jgi:putative addiction module component (TIGR02574 family)
MMTGIPAREVRVMAPQLEAYGIDQLSVADRIALVGAIWDSIAEAAERAPLTDAEKAEVDRRLAAHRANPRAAVPWEQVEAEALARLRK